MGNNIPITFGGTTTTVLRNRNTDRFYKDVRKYKPLSREEEEKLFKKLSELRDKINNCCDESKVALQKEYFRVRDELVNANQRLVIAAAKNYATTDSLLDYINEINFGLIDAIERFDSSKGFKFSTYAIWYIIRSINNYRYGDASQIKRSNNYKVFHVLAKARNEFIQQNEREPSTDELLELINEKYNKDIKSKYDLLTIVYTNVDGDDDNDNDNVFNKDYFEYNSHSATTNSYNKLEDNEFNTKLVGSLLNILTPKEQKVLKLKYGIDDPLKRGKELNEIAEIMNLTPERVRQIKIVAIGKMKEEYKRRLRGKNKV